VVKLKLMDKIKETEKVTPPRIMEAITAGFHTVTKHIDLILFPILIDLALWFGPQLRMGKILGPLLDEVNQRQLNNAAADAAQTQMMEVSRETLNLFLDRMNFSSSISTFPIGIPSLLSYTGIKETPLGTPLMIELQSLGFGFLLIIVLSLIGILLGGLYFGAIARKILPETRKLNFMSSLTQIIQGFLLIGIFFLAIMAVVIPVSLLLTVAFLFSPAIFNFLFIAISFILLWMVVPLIFAPHGVFAMQMNAPRALLTSYRLVRSFLPGTGLFALICILMASGLDVLWYAAPGKSWLTFIGIIGHAFIYTSLLAASFIYYRQGMDWMQKNINQFAKSIKI